MAKYDPSFGCDDEIIRAEEEASAEAAWWRDNRDRVLDVTKTLILSPTLRVIEPPTNMAKSVVDLAGEIVRQVTSRGEDMY